jgi:hypothetical protein
MMTGGQLFQSCMRKYGSVPANVAPCYAWAVQTVRQQAPQRQAVHGMGEYFAANGLGADATIPSLTVSTDADHKIFGQRMAAIGAVGGFALGWLVFGRKKR